MAYPQHIKNAYRKAKKEVRDALKDKGIKYYGILLHQQHPEWTPVMIYNAMNSPNCYNWEILCAVGALAGLELSNPLQEAA